MAGTRAQVLGSFYCSSLCDLMSVYVEDVSLAVLGSPRHSRLHVAVCPREDMRAWWSVLGKKGQLGEFTVTEGRWMSHSVSIP